MLKARRHERTHTRTHIYACIHACINTYIHRTYIYTYIHTYSDRQKITVREFNGDFFMSPWLYALFTIRCIKTFVNVKLKNASCRLLICKNCILRYLGTIVYCFFVIFETVSHWIANHAIIKLWKSSEYHLCFERKIQTFFFINFMSTAVRTL